MVVAGRQKSIAFFIALAAGLIAIAVLLYIGWVLLNWRTGILLFLGVILTIFIIGGIVLNTTFLVREIRRNEQHDAFINAVTHELKTPVASIRLYLETLQRRDVSEEKRQEFYQVMLEDSDRLLSTIEQVLRTGRVGHASHKPAFAPVEVVGLVDQCVQRARKLHRLADGDLKFLPCAPVTLQADAEEVRAAVSNLIDNAVKYSRGPARIEVETEPVDDRYVAIRVRDQGVGIPRGELKQIFKRFYRVPGMSASKVKGTGLGLYIVRSVAKRHRGRVWAESEGAGKGSTFTLQLPIRP